MSNVIDKRKEFILKLARNMLDADAETKRRVIGAYPNLLQRDIFAAIVLLQKEADRRTKK